MLFKTIMTCQALFQIDLHSLIMLLEVGQGIVDERV